MVDSFGSDISRIKITKLKKKKLRSKQNKLTKLVVMFSKKEKSYINYEGYCVSSIIHYLTLKLKYLKKNIILLGNYII